MSNALKSVEVMGFWTSKQLADLLGQPAWRVRQVCDELGASIRAGRSLYRIVPKSCLPAIVAQLDKHDWLKNPVPRQRAQDLIAFGGRA